MIVNYDWETQTREYKCECCGYIYKVDESKELKYDKVIVGDEEFIELGQTDIVKGKNSFYGSRIEKTTLYACPKCGCVQIII